MGDRKMLKTIKHQVRGTVYGFLLATVLWGVLLFPHTQFRISASNVPVEQQLAQDQSVSLAKLMPPTKPVQK
jgi:hypothetical protein